MTTAHKRILLIAAIDVAVLVVGVFGATWGEQKGFLAFAAGAIALVTFFGSLAIEAPEKTRVSPAEDGPIRRAIASAIVMMYLVLVATFAFFGLQPPLDGLLLNFTTTTGVVIGFYFGSSVYLEARRLAAKERDREREIGEYGA